jgi:hypothetical protein
MQTSVSSEDPNSNACKKRHTARSKWSLHQPVVQPQGITQRINTVLHPFFQLVDMVVQKSTCSLNLLSQTLRCFDHLF